MSSSELKTILRALVAQVDDLRVNEAVLLAKTNGPLTLGEIRDIRKAAETTTKQDLAELRAWIEAL